MRKLVGEFKYNINTELNIDNLFDTLSSKRRKHLLNIHNDMSAFLMYYGDLFSPEEVESLTFAAKYHDLGYHDVLIFTNNHALDFVLYLEKETSVSLLTKKLILFHTMSDEGLESENIKELKKSLTKREQFLITVISYFDMQTNLKGDTVSLESRLYSVRRRKKLSVEFILWTKAVRDIMLYFMLKNGRKALVFDVDNTISFDNHISQINIDEIIEYKDMGFEIIFNTGKLPHSIYEVEKELGFQVHKICLNGNVVSEDVSNLKVLKDINDYKETCKSLLENNNIGYIEYTKNGVELNDTLSDQDLQKIKDVGDFYLSNEKSELIKIICFIEQEEKEKQRILKEYVKGKNIDVVRTSKYFYEIVPSVNNKGTGLLKLLKDLNIYHRATLGFGDNYNDLPMFKYVGRGYLVNTAGKYLKARGYEVINGNPKTAVGNKLKEIRGEKYGRKDKN